MKQDTTGRRGQRAWRGVTATCATVLALSVSAGVVVDSFRTDIDKFLGTKSSVIVTEDADPATVYTYKSDYSLWSNLTIHWGCGTNLHRVPYNSRNHEYYSEDAVLTAGQGTAYVAAAKEYGCIEAPKHLAFNDTEVNRTGVAVFMTEQQARENELRGVQAIIEDAGALGVMTAYNRVGCYTSNSHTGLMINILRGEWGFQGLMSEDFIQDANYTALKEAVMNGITMSCNTGDSTMEAVSEKWPYWTVENVSQDATLMAALKQVMLWQNYALANSNAMDGLSSTSRLVSVRTWYDNALTGVQIAFALLTLAGVAMYIRAAKRKKS